MFWTPFSHPYFTAASDLGLGLHFLLVCLSLYHIRPNYHTVRLHFSKLLGTLSCIKICINLLRVHYKKISEKDLFDDGYAIFVPDFLHKGIYCGYLFELHRQVDAIRMSTHKICLYKEVDQNYTGCSRKTTKLLDCALIGVCAVITGRSNMVLMVNMVYTVSVSEGIL